MLACHPTSLFIEKIPFQNKSVLKFNTECTYLFHLVCVCVLLCKLKTCWINVYDVTAVVNGV